MSESSQPSHTPNSPETDSASPGGKPSTVSFSPRFIDILGWLITGVWALSMVLHAASIGYEPPPSIHILMMGVAGAAFGTNFIRPKNGG